MATAQIADDKQRKVINRLRKMGKTQKQIADETGINANDVSLILGGKRRIGHLYAKKLHAAYPELKRDLTALLLEDSVEVNV